MNRFSPSLLWAIPACLLLTLLVACNEPEPTEFLAGNIDEWTNQFQVENETLWSVSDGKLVFGGDEKPSKLTVLLDSLPSDFLKPGRITASVEVNDLFKEEERHSFYGFGLNKRGADHSNSIIFGLTGAGSLVAFDHNMVPLPIKVSTPKTHTPLHDNTGVVLTFAMYGNKKGWTIDCLVRNCEEENIYMLRASIVTEAKTKFDELSLVAYKPLDSHTPLWFRNLKIWKDWVPID